MGAQTVSPSSLNQLEVMFCSVRLKSAYFNHVDAEAFPLTKRQFDFTEKQRQDMHRVRLPTGGHPIRHSGEVPEMSLLQVLVRRIPASESPELVTRTDARAPCRCRGKSWIANWMHCSCGVQARRVGRSRSLLCKRNPCGSCDSLLCEHGHDARLALATAGHSLRRPFGLPGMKDHDRAIAAGYDANLGSRRGWRLRPELAAQQCELGTHRRPVPTYLGP